MTKTIRGHRPSQVKLNERKCMENSTPGIRDNEPVSGQDTSLQM